MPKQTSATENPKNRPDLTILAAEEEKLTKAREACFAEARHLGDRLSEQVKTHPEVAAKYFDIHLLRDSKGDIERDQLGRITGYQRFAVVAVADPNLTNMIAREVLSKLSYCSR